MTQLTVSVTLERKVASIAEGMAWFSQCQLPDADIEHFIIRRPSFDEPMLVRNVDQAPAPAGEATPVEVSQTDSKPRATRTRKAAEPAPAPVEDSAPAEASASTGEQSTAGLDPSQVNEPLPTLEQLQAECGAAVAAKAGNRLLVRDLIAEFGGSLGKIPSTRISEFRQRLEGLKHG